MATKDNYKYRIDDISGTSPLTFDYFDENELPRAVVRLVSLRYIFKDTSDVYVLLDNDDCLIDSKIIKDTLYIANRLLCLVKG